MELPSWRGAPGCESDSWPRRRRLERGIRAIRDVKQCLWTLRAPSRRGLRGDGGARIGRGAGTLRSDVPAAASPRSLLKSTAQTFQRTARADHTRRQPAPAAHAIMKAKACAYDRRVNVHSRAGRFRRCRMTIRRSGRAAAAERGQARWAGSFGWPVAQRYRSLNARLAEECGKHGQGLLVRWLNQSKLPDWQEDLRSCHRATAARYPAASQFITVTLWPDPCLRS